jgi:hypothetical protein
MPTAARLIVSDEPPALMKGSVMPVIGSSETTTPTLMMAWTVIQVVIPAASSPPNVSGAARATRNPSYARSAKSPITTSPPRSPNSSPMIAKMKSFEAFGR